jgi:hypothetical protein
MTEMCVDPPALEDWQLLAWLEGEADSPVQDHLDRCPFCRQHRDQLVRQVSQLKTRLYRSECPRPVELSRFHRNQLSAERLEWIQGHVDGCPHCTREVALLQHRVGAARRAYFPEPETAPEDALGPLVEGARILLARLIGGPSQLLPVRGAGAGPRLYEAEDFKISVDSQPDDQEPERRQVIGSLLGAPGAGWSVEFWASGEPVSLAPAATAPVDDLGFFTARGLTPGRYGLNVRSPDGALEVRVPNVAV